MSEPDELDDEFEALHQLIASGRWAELWTLEQTQEQLLALLRELRLSRELMLEAKEEIARASATSQRSVELMQHFCEQHGIAPPRRH